MNSVLDFYFAFTPKYNYYVQVDEFSWMFDQLHDHVGKIYDDIRRMFENVQSLIGSSFQEVCLANLSKDFDYLGSSLLALDSIDQDEKRGAYLDLLKLYLDMIQFVYPLQNIFLHMFGTDHIMGIRQFVSIYLTGIQDLLDRPFGLSPSQVQEYQGIVNHLKARFESHLTYVDVVYYYSKLESIKHRDHFKNFHKEIRKKLETSKLQDFQTPKSLTTTEAITPTTIHSITTTEMVDTPTAETEALTPTSTIPYGSCTPSSPILISIPSAMAMTPPPTIEYVATNDPRVTLIAATRSIARRLEF